MDRKGGFPVGLQTTLPTLQPSEDGVRQHYRSHSNSATSADAAVAMTPLPAQGVGEPFLSVPTPPGWTAIHDHNSTLVRGALVNVGLWALDFTPTAVITLADVSEDSRTAHAALATEHAGVEAQPEVSDVASLDGTLCGYASRTLTYRYEGRNATTLIVAGTDWSARTWVCTLGIQTAVPEDARFVRDRAIILENFQFLVLQGGGMPA